MDFEDHELPRFRLIVVEGDPTVGVKVLLRRVKDKSNLAAFGNVTYETGKWEWDSVSESIAGSLKRKPSILDTLHPKTMSKCYHDFLLVAKWAIQA